MNICGHHWANKNNSNIPQLTNVTFQPQPLVFCGCSKIGTELNYVPNENSPCARCSVDTTVAWTKGEGRLGDY